MFRQSAFFMYLRSCNTGALLVMKTLEDEWYVVIKAYKLAVFEILGDFFLYCHNILRVRAIPTLESTDSMIITNLITLQIQETFF